MQYFQTFGQLPKDFEEAVVTDGATKSLETTKFNYAVVQFNETVVGDYTAANRVGRYRVDGNAPTVNSGFIAGNGDTRIFTRGELRAGVQLISAEAGKSFTAVIQYYNSLEP